MRESGDPTRTLPDNPAALQALLVAAWAERDSIAAERDSVVAERDALAERNERLQHLLRKLQRMQFGPRSERLPEGQLQFAFEEVEASLAGNEAAAEKRSPDLRQKNTARRRAGRGRLPAHLPRIEQVLVPESTACPCCRGAMVEIGADTAERLDVLPAQFRVLVTKRPKYACRACEGIVVQAPAPARLIEGGMPTEAAVAHVLVARYADHMPLYRQAQGLARQGIEIGREVLAGSVRPPSRSGRWWRDCARSSSPRCGCLPTRPPCRCSIQAGARPRRVTPGQSRAMTGPGAAPSRRRWCSTTPPAAGPSTPGTC
jgi:transposase